jgi:hypothetical protein
MMMRSVIAAAVFGAIVGSGLAGASLSLGTNSSSAVTIDDFTFTPQTSTVKAGHRRPRFFSALSVTTKQKSNSTDQGAGSGVRALSSFGVKGFALIAD